MQQIKYMSLQNGVFIQFKYLKMCNNAQECRLRSFSVYLSNNSNKWIYKTVFLSNLSI